MKYFQWLYLLLQPTLRLTLVGRLRPIGGAPGHDAFAVHADLSNAEIREDGACIANGPWRFPGHVHLQDISGSLYGKVIGYWPVMMSVHVMQP